jgi:glutathione S-transferase
MVPGDMAAAVVLRYFPMVGRAQPLRHALADAAVSFDDLRIPLSQWPQHKEDTGFAGPYGGLPTLSWGPVTVAETLPIASFLARRLGHYEGLDDAAIGRLEGICSNCYIEVMLRIGEIIWADLLYPGMDFASAIPRHLARMLDKLGRLDARTPEVGWLGGERPGMADFFAAEAVEAQRYVLGPAREEALHTRLPRLTALAQRVQDRPAIASAWKDRPQQFTGRPDEMEIVERLRALDVALAAL